MNPTRLKDALQTDLDTQAATSQAEEELEGSLAEFCQAHIQLRSQPFSFEGHEYLREPYADEHPDQTDQKAAQTGLSTLRLYEGFYLAKRYGAKVLYYLSTDDDAYDFSQDRINVAIDDSPYLQAQIDERERGRDNAGLRHIGRGSLYCRGVFTRRKVKSVDGDVLILDETDEADQANLQFALDRILHSSLQYVRRLSQPSIPDYGINEAFQQTDQRYWHLICPACGDYNCLELALDTADGRMIPKHILEIPEKLKHALWVKPGQCYYRACLKCHAPLDMAKGEWVAAYPSQAVKRGRQYSQLYRQLPMVGYADPADWIMARILTARKTIEKTRVTISVLGVPYGGDRQPITDAVLNDCEGDTGLPTAAGGCFMGLDQGDDLHIVVYRPVRGGKQLVALEHTDDWDRIGVLIRQWGVVCAVGDALPNKKAMKDEAWAAPSSCKFFIQYFAGESLKQSEEGEGQKAVRKVTVDRTESLDETADAFKAQEFILPDMHRLDGEVLRIYERFRSQLKMLVKDLVPGANGVLRWQYKKNVPNHFGMAANSARIAEEIWRGAKVDYNELATSGEKTATARIVEATGGPVGVSSESHWRGEGEGAVALSRPTTGLTAGWGYGA